MLRILLMLCVCAVALGAGLYLGGRGASDVVLSERIVFFDSPRQIASAGLVDQDGRERGKEAFTGKWTIAYFGFTHCPDICPNSLSLLNQVKTRLADEGSDVHYTLVTVDPERDTPERLKQYVGHFNKDFTALTGTVESITELTSSIGVVAVKVPQDDMPGGYTVDHSSVFALINPAAPARRTDYGASYG